ncbi:MAG TPA: response regulator [Thermoanaerobaculia bacterium]|nr:response regulator [Thermoanaerobaculia bacterium]HUM29104.1 response regulator [Thermoanaerobaculia bacterium]HXK67481.1 response regulator [Thermoanaerobaculia bacterium]
MILKRILYVEDDPEIQKIACLTLERIGGFTVELCGSGEEAVRRAPEFLPDVILMDVLMPGMDGLTTLRALRALPQTAHIPVIFLTAMAQVHEVEHYRNQGAADVITKPFDPIQLPGLIRAIWEQATALHRE